MKYVGSCDAGSPGTSVPKERHAGTSLLNRDKPVRTGYEGTLQSWENCCHDSCKTKNLLEMQPGNAALKQKQRKTDLGFQAERGEARSSCKAITGFKMFLSARAFCRLWDGLEGQFSQEVISWKFRLFSANVRQLSQIWFFLCCEHLLVATTRNTTQNWMNAGQLLCFICYFYSYFCIFLRCPLFAELFPYLAKVSLLGKRLGWSCFFRKCLR